MQRIAAMPARSDTVRGAPPGAWQGGGGSSGGKRCHRWSGSRRSAKLGMAGQETQRQTGLLDGWQAATIQSWTSPVSS